MECTIYRILITGYIDNELSDDETHQLKSHLHACHDCVAHLQKMERMQSVLKRYQLVQDIPDASPNFARNISQILQETTPAKQPSPFLVQAFSRYRGLVLRLVEYWIASLRARPVTWVTAMSCVLVVMAGVVFMDVTHSIQPPPQYALLSSEPVDVAKDRPVTIAEPSSVIPVALHEDAAEHDASGLPDFIQFSDEPVVQIAKNNSESVDSYVYSHIVEASQEQFLDNVVFASYVQDALF